MEFYSAMEKNEILSFSSKWMELENMLKLFQEWGRRHKGG
jgi:hypothetical protein